MYEYVKLRVAARNIAAASSGASRGTSADLAAEITPRIVGGVNAGAADNPFQVGLLMGAQPNNARAQFCGGSLIRANVVVTAAHCSDFVQANQVQALTGTRRLDGTGQRRDVARIVIHPQWNSTTFDHDVALWQLSTSATDVPLAALATGDGPDGADLLATGWGALTEAGGSPADLQRVLVPLVARANCNDANSYNNGITDNMICAGLDAGGRDTCQGDSGGPLTRGATQRVLTGITSWGRGCARPNLFGVYTRVSRGDIRTFIDQNVGDLAWDHIGHADNVVALAAINNKLFAATRDNRLWWRDPVGQNVAWQHIGHANNVVAMAAINNKLFAATTDNRLWWRDPVGQDVAWQPIGHANDVVAMAAIGNKLFAATRDNRLWWRDPVGQNVPWQHIGHANDVVGMAAINDRLFAATRDNRLWWRDPVGQDVPWQDIGHANAVAAMTAINDKLFAATRDNRLWWRDPVR